ncbi:MAG: hypothetical protein F6K25_14925 [Okeania sp. SIO2G4]|uniref:hypothetical protein n=1 Tax=unclassified Okeania TaxID=2634635 RepID=UPI0013BA023A|nr:MULTISPECIES: hypothetical protein [unclassified Okeania]NEP04702.1 hypothetical protein [Okeania sp. SIO4D6]NEP43374.1 hypothetical protein [Okeania sp. SIO2H7]NEP73219.1 hypothetical protein [Okeania sp. SIO2G5]NEP94083.1 hypothetical protein [Okeania sp. SIO2F5]NEQ91914.1 hypothetical protein [Okeania sp. SIO2G4]
MVRLSIEEGRRKKEEARIKKEKVDSDSVRQATLCLQTPSNCKHRLDGRVLNPKEKDKLTI